MLSVTTSRPVTEPPRNAILRVFADDFVERLRFEVDPRWQGELPRTYLHGPGKAVAGFTGTLDAQRVEQWLQSVSR